MNANKNLQKKIKRQQVFPDHKLQSNTVSKKKDTMPTNTTQKSTIRTQKIKYRITIKK